MITFNNKVVTYNHKWIYDSVEPYNPNPLNLPPRTFQIDGSYSLNYIKRVFDTEIYIATGTDGVTVNATSYEHVYVTINEGGVERTVPRWNVTIDYPWWFTSNSIILDNTKSISGYLNIASSQIYFHCYGMNLTDVYDMHRIGDWFTSIDYCYAPDLLTPDNTLRFAHNGTFSIDSNNYYHYTYTDSNVTHDLKLYKDDNIYLANWFGSYNDSYITASELRQFFGESPSTYIKFIIGPYLQTLRNCFYPCHNLQTAIILSPNGCNVTNMERAFSTDGGYLSHVELPDTSKVTNMESMFKNNWSSFQYVPSFNTSNVTDISEMFYNCAQLREIPNLTFGKVTDCEAAFNGTYNANTGILRAYNNLINQTTQPTSHSYAFRNSGRDSVTGAVELAQIPSDWK